MGVYKEPYAIQNKSKMKIPSLDTELQEKNIETILKLKASYKNMRLLKYK